MAFLIDYLVLSLSFVNDVEVICLNNNETM